MIENLTEFWLYFKVHGVTILLSLPYFLFLSFLGVFLVLRRSTLYGLVLSQAAQVSFILGVGWHFKSHGDAFQLIQQTGFHIDENLLHLDLYVFPLTLIFLLPFVYFSSKLSKIRESSLLLALLFFANLLPIANRWVGGSEKTLLSLYFSELLYTSSKIFLHYLPHLLLVFVLFLFSYKGQFLAGFDFTQAELLGIKANWANGFFYFLVGMGISISLRVLGIYLTMAALIAPAVAALAWANSLNSLYRFTFIFLLLSIILGFTVAFFFPAYPTEAILVVSFVILSSLAYLTKRWLNYFRHNL